MWCRYGIQGLVIDPFNELDQTRDKYTTETAYVGHLIDQIKAFAQVGEVDGRLRYSFFNNSYLGFCLVVT